MSSSSKFVLLISVGDCNIMLVYFVSYYSSVSLALASSGMSASGVIVSCVPLVSASTGDWFLAESLVEVALLTLLFLIGLLLV